jgi:hypothetical protein
MMDTHARSLQIGFELYVVDDEFSPSATAPSREEDRIAIPDNARNGFIAFSPFESRDSNGTLGSNGMSVRETVLPGLNRRAYV